MDKKIFSTFSYKLVQISPIMILVNSGAFLSISSWFCELTELIFVMIPLTRPQSSIGLCCPRFPFLNIMRDERRLGTSQMIPYISSLVTPKTQGTMGHVQVANGICSSQSM